MASLNGVIGNGASLFQSYETTPAAEKVRRHPKYYLNGGDVHFLVENYIFRVHRYFFERESQIFREKLGAPPPPGQTPKGSSDTNPFPLDDVREIDFSRFLWVFYNPKYSVYDANSEEWISIMKLAFEWKFAEVKRLSTRYLEKFTLDPIRKIELYQWYQIDKRLLIPSYLAVINRREPLSLEEGRRLTLETALLIATARECARGKRLESGLHSPIEATVDADSMISIVKEVFALGDTTPSSPCLEPIAEGAGPSVFTATLMSPSKIITSPPREDAMSPTPAGKGPAPTIIGGPVPQLQPLVAPVSTTPPPPPGPFLVQPKPQQATSQSAKEPSVPSVPPYLAFNHSAAPSPISAKAPKSTFEVMKEAGMLPSTPAATTPATPAPAPTQAATGDASKTGPPEKSEASSTTAPPPPASGAASTGATSSDATKGDNKDAKNVSGKDVQPPAKSDVKPADVKSGNAATESKPADNKSAEPPKSGAPEPPKSAVPETPRGDESRPATPSTPNPNGDDGASEGGADSFSQKWLKKASAARAGKNNTGGQGTKRR